MDSSGANPGRKDRIPVPLWNRMVRATDIVERLEPQGVGESTPQYRAGNTVLAQNSSGSDIGRYGVARITGILTDPTLSDAAAASFQERPIVKVGAPLGSDISWGVAIDPIADGRVARVALGGVVPVKVVAYSDAHQFARPAAGDTTALATCHGIPGAAPIVWRQAGTGSVWALVRIGCGSAAHRLCKTSSSFAKGSTATLDVWEDGTPPSEARSTGVTVAGVVNKFANIGSGKWVSVALHANGYWYVVSAECG